MHRFAATVLLSAALNTALTARAGDLTPPPGPVTPTDRVTIHGPTLTLPFTIDEPGSYVLTGNITAVPDQHAIIIASDNVTLDLNGFALTGLPDALSAIADDDTDRTNITIINGTITGWGAHGIALDDADNARITGTTASDNGGTGIALGNNAIVERCTASNNADGIAIDSGVIRDCLANANAQNGLSVASRGTVTRCNATANGISGITTQSRSSIRNNHTTSNAQAGILVTGSFNMVQDNTSSFDGIGIGVTSSSNTIFRNVVTFATTSSYDIAGSNTTGPIINTTGGGTVTSAQPFANIEN